MITSFLITGIWLANSLMAQVGDCILKGRAIIFDSLNWEARDIQLSADMEKLAVVGTVFQKNGDKDAFFYLLNAKTGRGIQPPHIFEMEHDQEFLSVAESHRSNFYAVGYRETGLIGQSRKAWAVEFDPNGQLKGQLPDPDRAMSQYEKIAWPLESEQGVLVGRTTPKATSVRFGLLRNQKVTIVNDAFGEENIGNILSLDPLDGKRIWFCANTPAREGKSGQLYVATLNNFAQLDGLAHLLRSSRGGLPVNSVTVDAEGDLLLSGKVKTDAGRLNGLVREVGIDGNENLPIEVVTEKTDSVSIAFKTSMGEYWMMYHTGEKPEWQQHIMRKKVDLEIDNCPLLKGENFHPRDLFYTGFQELAMLSNRDNPSIKRARAFQLNYFSDVADKINQLSVGPVVSRGGDETADPIVCGEVTLGEGGGTCLPPDQSSGVLWFTVKSNATETLNNGRVTAELLTNNGGLILNRSTNRLQLQARQETRLPFSFDIKPAFRGATVRFKVFDAAGNLLCSEDFTLQTCSADATTVADTGSPCPVQKMTGSYKSGMVTRENHATIQFMASGPQNMRRDDARVAPKSGTATPGPRAGATITVSDSGQTNIGCFYAVFDCVLQDLKEGDNPMEVWVKGQMVDTFTIHYEPKRYSLKVIGIAPQGPSYNNLFQTQRDVNDMVDRLTKFNNTNLIAHVDKKVLTKPEETSLVELDILFKTLYEERDQFAESDILLIYLVGHGKKVNEKIYFLTSDEFREKSPEKSALDLEEVINKYLNNIKCKKILITDACNSGQIPGVVSRAVEDKSTAEALDALSKIMEGTAAFHSCAAEENSYESAVLLNGYYTEAFLEALAGKPVQSHADPKVWFYPDSGHPTTNCCMSESDGQLILASENQHPAQTCCPKRVDTQCKFVGEKDGYLSGYEIQNFLAKRVPDLISKHEKIPVKQNPTAWFKGFDCSTRLFSLPK